MTHRRIISLLLVSILVASSAGVSFSAAEDKAPVVLILPGTVGASGAISDLDAVEAVRMYVVGLGKVEVVAFDPDNPTIARYIMERKFGDDALLKIAEPATAKEIAGLLAADYLLTVHCEAAGDAVRLALRLTRTSGQGTWIAGAESAIASVDGPQRDLSRKNAISTAASSAVSQLNLEAFSKVKPKVTPAPATEGPVSAVPVITPAEPVVARDLVAEYTAHMNAAEQYILRKDMLNAIYELRQAVDIEPKTVSIRLKLADAYSAAGMEDRAADELQRAMLFASDDPSIHSTLGQFYLSTGSLQKAAEQFLEAARLDPDNVDVRVILGNILWNQNKLDEAAIAFEEAARMDPANPAPHDRLHKLYLARKNYPLAVEHLVAGRAGGKELDAAARYRIVGEFIGAQLTGILGKLEESWKEYQAQEISRETYYADCKDRGARIEEIAAFLATQTAPDGLKGAHAHALLSASLLSQSSGTLISYLETDKQQYSEEAALFREEAATELDEFVKALAQ